MPREAKPSSMGEEEVRANYLVPLVEGILEFREDVPTKNWMSAKRLIDGSNGGYGKSYITEGELTVKNFSYAVRLLEDELDLDDGIETRSATRHTAYNLGAIDREDLESLLEN